MQISASIECLIPTVTRSRAYPMCSPCSLPVHVRVMAKLLGPSVCAEWYAARREGLSTCTLCACVILDTTVASVIAVVCLCVAVLEAAHAAETTVEWADGLDTRMS